MHSLITVMKLGTRENKAFGTAFSIRKKQNDAFATLNKRRQKCDGWHDLDRVKHSKICSSTANEIEHKALIIASDIFPMGDT